MRVLATRKLEEAIDWRNYLITTDTDTIRLFAGNSDGTDGLFIDRFGDFIAVTLYDPLLAAEAATLVSALESMLPGKSILVKARKKTASNEYEFMHNLSWRREAVHTATESGLHYEIHTDPRHDFGLYTDTKAPRSELAAWSC